MALPRYSQTFQNLVNRVQPKAAPGTIGAAYQSWSKSPLLGGLPPVPGAGFYNSGGVDRKYYSATSPKDTIDKIRIQMELQQSMGGGGLVGTPLPPSFPGISRPAITPLATSPALTGAATPSPVKQSMPGQLQNNMTQPASAVGANLQPGRFYK